MMSNVRYVAVILAFLLLTTWTATVWDYTAGFDDLRDFKVEIPTLTILSLYFFRLPLLPLLSILLVALALPVAIARRWAWGVGLLAVILMLVANIGALLPHISLMNGLVGGDMADFSPVPPKSIYMPSLLVLGWNLVALAAFGLAMSRRPSGWQLQNRPTRIF